uniref:RNA-binding protein 42 n=1 Tax=Labrus bergylta TaxID=56723 RepID=A0A3Q3FU50_9LABR
MALKSGEERLKEMEAEMALFEQEVLGGPVPVAGGPSVMEGLPVAISVTAVPMIRPIIGTNTYRQVQQTLEARAATFVGPPPTFVGPVPPVRPPMLRPAFVPHILQRPVKTCLCVSVSSGGPRMPMMRPTMAPPLPRPPPPPPMMLPPNLQLQTPPGAPQEMVPMVSGPPMRQGPPPPIKPTPSIIQAAPTVYSAPPTPAGHKRIDVRAQRQARMVSAVCLLSSMSVFYRRQEPVESATEDKKKGKGEKVKKCIRTAAGTSWEDASLLEWETDDFRIFCGDLGNEVNDDILARAFSRYPSFLKAKVVRDKRTGKTKGYGFVSFKDPNDYVRAMREMNGKYVGSRPIKLRKSMWKDRNMEVVRKKQKEKKKLGLR